MVSNPNERDDRCYTPISYSPF
ncbi:hypothetical protein NC653_039685 [Populus alba x Populus x berolinensis]|uniref:Uncharacterized protein n=1 Tax=Populus alba x Populus x berolinensis TaxID=444605 RepID=A0AAD6PRN0_9ROSI|nr:hypothetical protein NC653_039685 [Populus alba x Populus x berolinensis]